MKRLLVLLALLCAIPSFALSQTRALLVACSEFSSQPALGSAVSGNLQMIASALVSASPRLAALSVEDGTIGTREALSSAVSSAFSEADEDDLSLLYLCTHGILSSADDGRSYLLLGDGMQESLLGADDLYGALSGIPGEKLLVIDACYSGALIGRGASSDAPFPAFADASIHVLTSASGTESSWYYDSEAMESGAQSYFASAFAAGLGLYDSPEADADADGSVTLAELHRYLSLCVPSSSAQLLSSSPESIILPTSHKPMLSRPLTGFSFGSSLLETSDPVFEFSFTASGDTAVQYRLVEYADGGWDWAGAQTFLDAGDTPDGRLSPGRKHRMLSLDGVTQRDSGYLILQVFSLAGARLQLCAERLIAVQPAESNALFSLSSALPQSATGEIPLMLSLSVPAEIAVSIRDEEGRLIRRLCVSQLKRPSSDGVTRLYWDGRDDAGEPVDRQIHSSLTATAEAFIGGERRKVSCPLPLSSPDDVPPPDA